MDEHPGPAGVAETHSAVVFFFGDRAYKVKKPVDLGFLDFSTRKARQDVCHREVALNQRLSPDVYLGVADVTGPDHQLCEHFVVMRRMPTERRLSTLVTAGEPVDDHLWQLAHLIAAFHSRAERNDVLADHTATVDALARRWTENTKSLAEHTGPGGLDPEQIERIHALALRYLAGRHDLIEGRIEAGRACDGHGDLLADDIFCLDDGPRVLDCLEFDDELRYGDVVADVAFLAMDLERLGRPDLAEHFLAAYREHSADTWPASLVDHHIAYRAQVRAKVAAIRADQGDTAALDQARQLLDLAERHLHRARVRLILVGGLPGTGKSTLASGIGDALEATVLRSDEVRKELAGLPTNASAAAPYGKGIYTPAATAAAYTTLLSRAVAALQAGETVVLDASWTDEQWRTLARSVACGARADLVELHCEAPTAVAADRIRHRASTGNDPSDATPEIAAEMAKHATPWPVAETVDATDDPARVLSAALRIIRR